MTYMMYVYDVHIVCRFNLNRIMSISILNRLSTIKNKNLCIQSSKFFYSFFLLFLLTKTICNK